ncbi:MAG: SMR family transporter [Methylovulum sp.]|uniref:DMT family transporter n=1 Tax=Methylovulum sp. TaxID=1916980 RepID=UPI002613E1AA|nr:SMR family transporter [Methylovulum sp.]MDD2723202.1 SMR family transporter [Methylovulum sp.]MDD5123143.1 SMR family transporter [Methylovulum sp.]
MARLLLFPAGFVEIIFALSLKYNEGFTKLWPSVATMISGVGSFYLLMLAIKTLIGNGAFCSRPTLKTYNLEIRKHLLNQSLSLYKGMRFFSQMGVDTNNK